MIADRLRNRGITELHLRVVLVFIGILGLIGPLFAWSWSISATQVQHSADIQAIRVWQGNMEREHDKLHGWSDTVVRNTARIDDIMRRLDKLEARMALAGIKLEGDAVEQVR